MTHTGVVRGATGRCTSTPGYWRLSPLFTDVTKDSWPISLRFIHIKRLGWLVQSAALIHVAECVVYPPPLLSIPLTILPPLRLDTEALTLWPLKPLLHLNLLNWIWFPTHTSARTGGRVCVGGGGVSHRSKLPPPPRVAIIMSVTLPWPQWRHLWAAHLFQMPPQTSYMGVYHGILTDFYHGVCTWTVTHFYHGRHTK